MTRKERILVVLMAAGITILVLLGVYSLRPPEMPPYTPPVTSIDPPAETPHEEQIQLPEYTEDPRNNPPAASINPIPENKESGAISGKVFDDTNEPIHNATVTIFQMREALRYYFTSEMGLYYIGGLPAGVYVVRAERQGYATSTRNNVSVIKDQTTENIDFELLRGGIFNGSVVNENDEPVAGAKVTLYSTSPHEPSYGFDRAFHTTANDKGEFLIEDVAPGEYRALAQEEAHIQSERIPFTIDSDHPVEYKFVLRLGGTISGNIRDTGGNPVADAQIWLSSDDNKLVLARGARSDEDGFYELKGLKSGLVNIQVQSPDYIKQVKKGIEIFEGRNTPNIDFELDPGRSLIGTVMNASGEPVENASVSGNDKESYKTVKTDKNGRFILKGFEKDLINISVRADGYVLFVQRDIPANTEDYKVVLNSGGTVEGRAIADENLESFVVILYSIPEDDERRRPVRQKISNDPDGYFKVEDIPPGMYNLEVHSRDYIQVKPETIEIRENSSITGLQILLRLRTARR